MNSLWDFAVDFYQHAPIKTACLTLQDEATADVCVLLAVVWLGKQGKQLTGAETALLVSTIEVWQQKMTLPLRQLRKQIKSFIEADYSLDAEPIYQQIKAAELQAERVTLEKLQALIDAQRWLSDKIASVADMADMADVAKIANIENIKSIESPVEMNISLYLSQCQATAKISRPQQWEEVSALFVKY